MYTIGVSGEFQANHFLTGDVSEEEKTAHSHPYELRWEISVSGLDEQGFGINIAHMEEVRDAIVDEVSSQLLNDLSFFENIQTSIENLARFLLGKLNLALEGKGYDSGLWLHSKLTIYENTHAWASYQKSP